MIIKHGLVVDPASGLSEHMDILVKNGKIARIAPEISEDSEEILEAGGLVVGPGLIDTHIKKISIQEQRHLQKAGLLL